MEDKVSDGVELFLQDACMYAVFYYIALKVELLHTHSALCLFHEES